MSLPVGNQYGRGLIDVTVDRLQRLAGIGVGVAVAIPVGVVELDEANPAFEESTRRTQLRAYEVFRGSTP